MLILIHNADDLKQHPTAVWYGALQSVIDRCIDRCSLCHVACSLTVQLLFLYTLSAFLTSRSDFDLGQIRCVFLCYRVE